MKKEASDWERMPFREYIKPIRKYIKPIKNLVDLIVALSLMGRRYKCPICRWGFRRFKTFRGRENAECPKCGGLERHRLFWLFLKNKTNIFKEKVKILEIAPFNYIQSRLTKLTNVDYLSIDLHSEIAMQKMDAMDIKLPDNSYDYIFCSCVLDYVFDDLKAMKELLRVLKPTGIAFLLSPVDNDLSKTVELLHLHTKEERERISDDIGYVRIYGRDFADRLRLAGFNVQLIKYAKELKEEDIRKYCLMKEEILYICKKA